MPDRERLYEALRNAHAAGATEDAKKLAMAIRQLDEPVVAKDPVKSFTKEDLQLPAAPRTGPAQWLGVVNRALAPYATAAGIGAAAGGVPTGGVGAVPGALTGLAGLAVGDLGTFAYNVGAPYFGAPRATSPSELIREGAGMVGIGRKPETPAQRVVYGGLQGAAAGLGGAGGARALEQMATNRLAENVFRSMSAQPGIQTISGFGAGAAPAALQEGGVTNPLALFAASIAGGMSAGGFANRLANRRPALAETPSTQDLRAKAQEKYRESERQGVTFNNPTRNDITAANAAATRARQSANMAKQTNMPGPAGEAEREAREVFKRLGRALPQPPNNATPADRAAFFADAAENAVALPSFKSLGDDLRTSLTAAGFNESRPAEIQSILRDINATRAKSVTFEQLNTWNTAINNAIRGKDPNVVRFGQIIKERIDNFIMDDTSAATGSSPRAAQALKEARRNWTQMRKSETVEELIDRAQRRAELGADPAQAIRQEFNGLINNKTQFKMMTPDEQAAVRSVVNGNLTTNALRLVSSLAPTKSLAQILLAMLAASTGAVPAIVAGAGGAAAKAAVTRATQAQAENAARVMRGGTFNRPPRPSAKLATRLGTLQGAAQSQNAMRR